MNKKNCKEALDIYKKFLDRTDNVSAFLKVAEVREAFPIKEDFYFFTKKYLIFLHRRLASIKVIFQI